jgi:protein AbiQ
LIVDIFLDLGLVHFYNEGVLKAVDPTIKWELKMNELTRRSRFFEWKTMRLSFYHVDEQCINYLRMIESKVMITVKYPGANHRPMVGVVLTIDGINFFAPLSSPKPKHITMKDSQDLVKIDGGRLGVINLSNMIPVNLSSNDKYTNLMIDQLIWCNQHRGKITTKATKLYNSIVYGSPRTALKQRCRDFELLIFAAQKFQVSNQITI